MKCVVSIVAVWDGDHPGPVADGILAFARGLGFTPDAIQQELLMTESKNVLVNCCRQWGKSTMVAIKALWQMVNEPGSLVIAVGPVNRQSSELMEKSREMARSLGWKTRGDGTNAYSLMLENGSRMVALPGRSESTRGFSAVSMLVFDEAAFIPDPVFAAMRPMVAVSKGAVWMVSTPNGQKGRFYEAWVRGGEWWSRFEARAAECERIPADFLERERRELSEDEFRENYCCEFVSGDGMLFRPEWLAGLKSEDVEEWVL